MTIFHFIKIVLRINGNHERQVDKIKNRGLREAINTENKIKQLNRELKKTVTYNMAKSMGQAL